jgi:hypothetical protein
LHHNSIQQRSHGLSNTALNSFTSTQLISSFYRSCRSVRSLHFDDFYVLSIVMLLSTFGLILEKRTQLGKALSVSSTSENVILIS